MRIRQSSVELYILILVSRGSVCLSVVFSPSTGSSLRNPEMVTGQPNFKYNYLLQSFMNWAVHTVSVA